MKRLSALAGLFVLLTASTVWGQTTVLEPIVTDYGVPDTVTVWRPVQSTSLPAMTTTPAGTTTVTYSTPFTTSYSYSAAPVVTRYAPVEVMPSTTRYYSSSPVTTYYSPVTTYYAPPVTTYYSPVVTSYYAPSYVVGRGSIGQPVAYVPGQPVRNVLRFFSP